MTQADIPNVIQQAQAAAEAGDRATAIATLQSALKSNPRSAQLALALLDHLARAGQLEQALQAGHQALRIRPDSPDAHAALARVFRAQGRWDKAIAAYQAAIRLTPQEPELYRLLGDTFGRHGQLAAAEATFLQETRLRPSAARGWIDLGQARQMQNKLLEAQQAFTQATHVEPASAAGFHQLGVNRGRQGDLVQAEALIRHALTLNPNDYLIWHDLGVAMEKQNRPADAVSAFQEALRCRPESTDDIFCLATNRMRSGEPLEVALELVEHALAIDPNHVDSHGLRAILWLLLGRLREGFEEYEWRRKSKTFGEIKRSYGQPDWRGDIDPAGKTILLYPEQGLGDSIQFVRYAPLLARRGAKVLVESPRELLRLLATVDGIDTLIPFGDALPPHDLVCSLMSLPRAFGTLVETIPAEVPYIHPKKEWIEAWKQRIDSSIPSTPTAQPPQPSAQTSDRPRDSRPPRVGLAWAGSPIHLNDKNRSWGLERLRPIIESGRAAGIEFFSLQKGEAARQQQLTGLHLIDHTAALTDFAETAGLLSQLDLVISVDTAVIHLAGAMGLPVWVLLPYRTDWRWLLNRPDTPWYPTMRLYTKTKEEDWPGPVEALCRDLLAWREKFPAR